MMEAATTHASPDQGIRRVQKLYGVQYLRAAAALGVVVFHASERSGTHFAIGATGVDVFFVISGFIMWVIVAGKPMSPWQFLRERLERIAPLYWIATAVMVAGALAGLFPNMRLTAGHVIGSLAFIPNRSPSNGEIWPVLVQGWTLTYEMFFYAVFAASLLLPVRSRLAVLTGLFALLVVLGFSASSDNPLLLTYTNPLILEFLAGALIGKLWLEGKMPSPIVGVGLIVIATAGFAFVGITYVGFNAFVLGPLAAALLVGVLALERAGTVPRLRLPAYLGDASYSIYLWHTLAISVVVKAAAAASIPGPTTLVIAVIVGVVAGIVAHEILEKPIAAILRNRRGLTVIVKPAVAIHPPAPGGAIP